MHRAGKSKAAFAICMKTVQLIILVAFMSFGSNLKAQSFYRNGYIASLDEKYTSGMFRGWNAHFLVPMDDPSAQGSFNVFQYLQGRVPGLIISGPNMVKQPFVISYRMGRPALFLDEMRVDADLLSGININDIAFIKVFRPPFVGSFGGGSGAIAVYTKEGDEEL
jgi:hypothetical protein